MNENYRPMLDMLLHQRDLLLVGHEDPDCDCLGSLLALYRGFGGCDKGWKIALNDEIPSNLRFLPGLELMVNPSQLTPEDFAAVLLVDLGEPDRAGAYLPPLIAGKPLYCLDHHFSNHFQGQLALVEPEAAAAAELAAVLLEQAGISPDDETALCLYAAMAADTGCFRYLNTSSRCLRLAGQLLPQVDLELVRICLFENRSLANVKMMAACLNNIQVEQEGRLAWSFLSQEEMRRWQATAADCHNIVNYTLSLAGVKLGLLFEEHQGLVKLSFRCRRGFRVDQLAQQFGGGGHLLAAGCKLPGSLEEVRPPVLAAARQLLAEQRAALEAAAEYR